MTTTAKIPPAAPANATSKPSGPAAPPKAATPSTPMHRPGAASPSGADSGPSAPSYRMSLERVTIREPVAPRPGAFRSDAYSFGRGTPGEYRYELRVTAPDGKILFDKQLRGTPDAALSKNGDLVVTRGFTFSEGQALDLYRPRDGGMERVRSFGKQGLLHWGVESVVTFAFSPKGDKLAFSTCSYGPIDPATPYNDGEKRGNIYRTFIYDLASGQLQEAKYARPHQLAGGSYAHPSFIWSENGDHVAYLGRGPSHLFVFDARTGEHQDTYQIREELGFQGAGAVGVRGLSDSGQPIFEPSKFQPLALGPVMPLGE